MNVDRAALLDEEVARLHQDKIGVTLTRLTDAQAAYLGVSVDGHRPESQHFCQNGRWFRTCSRVEATPLSAKHGSAEHGNQHAALIMRFDPAPSHRQSAANRRRDDTSASI